jgi:hypothetical protein
MISHFSSIIYFLPTKGVNIQMPHWMSVSQILQVEQVKAYWNSDETHFIYIFIFELHFFLQFL